MIHLHCHSEYSSLDGVNTIEDLVNYDADSIAITDHGYMYGDIPFYDACKKAGKKPILGVEGYIRGADFINEDELDDEQNKSFHILLLAQNADGYRNLCKMSSIAATDDFYKTPVISKHNIEENSQNVIAMSGCVGGILSRLILNNDIDGAVDMALYFNSLFVDRYYLELMTANMEEQKIVNNGLIEIHKKTGIPIVVTCDAHYPNKGDAILQEIKFAIASNNTVNLRESDDGTLIANDGYFGCNNLYLMKEEEVISTLRSHNIDMKFIKSAIENTHIISDKCNVDFGNTERVYPEFEYSGNNLLYLKRLVNDGIKRIGKEDDKQYSDRVDYELNVAKDLKLVDYFLICYDIIKFCRDNEIFNSPGRGSAASSLICYALGITQVDPIEYDLSFNRFLTVAEETKYAKDGTQITKYKSQRISPADLDMDFSAKRRDDVIDYLQNKYNNIYKIATYSKMNVKSALKDVGRVLGIPYHIVNSYTKNIPYDAENDIDLTNVSGYNEIHSAYPMFFDIADRISGSIRHISSHAAGIVISPDPIYNHMFSYRKDTKNGGNVYIMQAEKDTAEEYGFLKLDILGLKTLDVLSDTINLSGEDYALDGNNVDNGVIKEIDPDNIIGVFQFDGDACKPNISRIMPKTLSEMAVVNAISRPGAAKHVDEYITNRRDSEKTYKTGNEGVDSILEETYGILLYQEQVMAIAGVLAGYNAVEQDVLRKFIGKKEGKDKIRKYEQDFIERSVANGFNKADVKNYWDLIVDHGGYSFNKSHAISYSLLGYYCLYLKYKYPTLFMASLLNSYTDDRDYVKKCISEFRKNGYKIYAPTLNTPICIPEDDGVRIGYSMIDGVGDSQRTISQIKALREIELEQAVLLGNTNSKILHNLVYAGAYDEAMKRADAIAMLKKGQQLSLFEKEERDVPTKKEIYQHEMDVLGFWVSEHPLGEYSNIINDNGLVGIVTNVKMVLDKNGNKMAFIDIETEESTENIVLFSNVYSLLETVDMSNHTLYINAKKGNRDSYIANDIKILSEHSININIGNYDINKLNLIKNELVYEGKGKCYISYTIEDSEKTFAIGDNLIFSLVRFASLCREHGIIFSIR